MKKNTIDIRERTPVFIHIPKTAGKSIRDTFSQVPNLIDIGHSTIDIQRKKKALPQTIFSFCFVRNPYSRIRSAFFHLSSIDEHKLKKLDEFSKNRLELLRIYKNNFEDFILDEGFKKLNLGHFEKQTRWLLDSNNEKCINFIGRFERLSVDVKTLADMFQLSEFKSLRHINKTKNKDYDMKEHIWTDEMVKIVLTHYHCDFDLLGYSYDLKKITSPPSTP